MVEITTKNQSSKHPLAEYIERLLSGDALLPDTPENLIEVVGVLHSYGVVLDAYSNNLIYFANNQFLVFFPFFKYFNGEINLNKLLRHWGHDRINYEYAEYCMKSMLWHGGAIFCMTRRHFTCLLKGQDNVPFCCHHCRSNCPSWHCSV